MWTKLNHFATLIFAHAKIKSDEGQALVEYALIITLVSIVALAALTELGADLAAKLTEVREGVSL
jgi:Flp pilus assembly pilin Flp